MRHKSELLCTRRSAAQTLKGPGIWFTSGGSMGPAAVCTVGPTAMEFIIYCPSELRVLRNFFHFGGIFDFPVSF